MPLYDYTCRECEHHFESLIRNANEESALTCPMCGSKTIVRAISLPARPLAATATTCGQGPPCGAPYCRRTG